MMNIREDIAEMFAELEGYVDDGPIPFGFHAHEHLTTSRATTREMHTPAQKAEKRKALEANRRVYKTTKARAYYARKASA